MKGFWKIPKEWVVEWKLTATEALVLADLITHQDCPHKERAQRVGLSGRQLTRIKDKMSSDERTKCLLNRGQNVSSSEDKMSSNQKEKKENSPKPPIKKKKENKKITFTGVNVSEAKASTGEYTIQHRCRMIFQQIYFEKKNEKYYYAQKDAAALDMLLKKILFLMPEEEKNDKDKLEENFKVFVNAIVNNGKVDNWIIDNLSLPIINSKFNEIYSQLKNGKSRQQFSRHEQPTADVLTELL